MFGAKRKARNAETMLSPFLRNRPRPQEKDVGLIATVHKPHPLSKLPPLGARAKAPRYLKGGLMETRPSKADRGYADLN